MKITLVNHSDTLGGASVVTFRLMQALRALGVDARMLVTRKSGDSPFVVQAAPRWRSRIPFLAEHLDIFLHNGFSKANLFKASIATCGLPLSQHPLISQADAVILNWVNQGMLSLDEIGRIAALKPTLWTMHDMWNLTGICHHAGDCPNFTTRCHDCPLLGSGAGPHDLSARCFDRKDALFGGAGIRFVSVSSWLTRKAAESSLLGKRDVTTIPVAFPVAEYSRPAAATRASLGLPDNKKLIVMCAARLDDPIKGLPVAIDALNSLNADAVAVFVGAIRDPHALDGLAMPHIALGPVGETTVRAVMAHADIVLSSSSYESFGATLLEGQAAGATPVGYTHDGRADIISDGATGYSAGTDPTDARALARALTRALTQPIPAERLAAGAARFSGEAVARRYIDLLARDAEA